MGTSGVFGEHSTRAVVTLGLNTCRIFRILCSLRNWKHRLNTSARTICEWEWRVRAVKTRTVCLNSRVMVM